MKPFLLSCRDLLHTYAYVFAAIAWSICTPAVAQQSFGGSPLPTTANPLGSHTHTVQMTLNADDLRASADWQAQQFLGNPLTVGRILPYSLSIKQAHKIRTNTGEDVYQLEIQAPGATGLLLYYDRFYIPPGARLFIFTPEKNQVLGAFTHETNSQGQAFATDALPGDKLIIQYEPASSNEPPQIEISGIGYLFRQLPSPHAQPPTHPGEFSSDICHVNINCSEGADWQKERDGIVQIIQTAGDAITYCSGTVINNTNEDFAPLVISAGHCRKGVKFDVNPLGSPCLATPEEFKQWIYRFHYARPHCGNNDYAERYAYTLVGADMLAFMPIEGQSDGLLVKLTKDIPAHYGVYYNGWNRTDVPSAKGVGIHHPRGDAMKISTYVQTLQTTQWPAYPHKGAEDAHWLCYFAATANGHGVTQSGSSGSALFGADHLLTGTLTGGSSQCYSVDSKNFYGKLAYHWNKFRTESDTSRMDIHLDPKGRGEALTMQGAYKPSNISLRMIEGIQATFANARPVLSWQNDSTQDPDVGIAIRIEPFDATGSPLAIVYKLLPATATDYTEERPDAACVRYTLSRVYRGTDNGREAIGRSRPVSVAIPLAMPQGLTADEIEVKADATTGVTLSWEKPTNYQIISRMSEAEAPTQTIGNVRYADPQVNHYKTLYFGTRYAGEAFAISKGARLIGVRFVSARSSRIHTDKVYIRNGLSVHKDANGNYFPRPYQGEEVDSIPIPSDLLQPAKWSTFLFPRPYLIKTNEMLTVGLQITTEIDFAKDVISIDRSKAAASNEVDNVFSFDGYRWMPISTVMNNATDRSMALELILDDAPLHAPIPRALPYGAIRGFSPTVFPRVASYRIYRDGSQIAEISAISHTLSYNDITGSTASTYSIYPVYTDGSIATSSEIAVKPTTPSPAAYPTVFGDGFSIIHHQEVASATLHDMRGRCVLRIYTNSDYVSAAHLPCGQYILRLHTHHGQEVICRLTKGV